MTPIYRCKVERLWKCKCSSNVLFKRILYYADWFKIVPDVHQWILKCALSTRKSVVNSFKKENSIFEIGSYFNQVYIKIWSNCKHMNKLCYVKLSII